MATVPSAGLFEGIRTRWSRSDVRADSDIDWLVPMVVAAIIAIGAWFLVSRMGFASPPMFEVYGLMATTILVVGALGTYLYQLFKMMRRGEQHPLARTGQWLRENLFRVVAALVAVQVSSAAAAAFAALKMAIPGMNPFWLDPYLLAAERALLGMHPWELSHRLLGWATPAIDFVYMSWIFAQIATFYVVLVLKPSPLKTRALVSYSFTWLVLGVLGGYLLSSAGPIYYDRIFGGDTFAALNASLRDAPFALRASELLWNSHDSGAAGIGAGISAMPSLHVAIALWIAMIVRETRFAVLGWVYFALICIGSVHLGWHYASDGLVSVLGFGLIWRASGLCVPSSARTMRLETAPAEQL